MDPLVHQTFETALLSGPVTLMILEITLQLQRIRTTLPVTATLTVYQMALAYFSSPIFGGELTLNRLPEQPIQNQHLYHTRLYVISKSGINHLGTFSNNY